jgi:hypothetical protein
MLDNVTVAVFTKLNALAERHGLKPYDFVATRKEVAGSDTQLVFEVHPTGDLRKEKQYDGMLRALGIPDDGHSLQGPDRHIIDLLDSALHRSRTSGLST